MQHFDNLSELSIEELSLVTKDWCLVNGLVLLEKNNEYMANKAQNHDSALPLPVTLFPTQYPNEQFQFALSIQNHFNELIYTISNDYEFLRDTLENVIKVDDFTSRLWNIYETVVKEGITQPISLGIFRNDYMLDSNKENKPLTKLSQIEINTISCSFGAATSQVTKLHRYLLNSTNNQDLIEKQAENDNVSVIAKAIVKAWQLYGNKNAHVSFLVLPDERNIGDQRLLEYKCFDLEPKIRIERYSLSDIYSRAKLDDQKNLIIDGKKEIALVYFRVGYDPEHYLNENDWAARLLIERSRAIKSPNIQLHLVGAKRIQQALCEENVLERFITDKKMAEMIRATFVDQFSFNKNNIDSLTEIMLKNCHDFVLKPQREGGGNNIYKEDIKKFVQTLNDKNDLMGYILMKLVKPSINLNYIVKANTKVEKKKLISEIGIFGVLIGKQNEIVLNETGGYLLRTKPIEVDEGGVATGYSALDSVFLV